MPPPGIYRQAQVAFTKLLNKPAGVHHCISINPVNGYILYSYSLENSLERFLS
jgi:hypothetical protein